MVAVWYSDSVSDEVVKKWICREAPNGEVLFIPVGSHEPVIRTQILTDTIEPTWHPVTGEYCSSRTGMQKIAKAHGLEELGNERIQPRRYEPDKKAIRERLIHGAQKLGIR